jgi:3-deoxy-D-manno-octulosonate 8-phosphate phosphatase (KDO 8-P phosphatase)
VGVKIKTEDWLPEISSELRTKAKKIKVILMDVDGVLTRGDIVYDSNGLEIKHFNAHDGQGIKLARVAGLKIGIISSRESGTIRTRAAELGMHYLYLGKDKKLTAFQELKHETGLSSDCFCFIGDDLPDIPVVREVGFGVAVKNAIPLLHQNADYISATPGGEGAVREVIEIILDSQDLLESTIEKILEQ